MLDENSATTNCEGTVVFKASSQVKSKPSNNIMHD